MNDLDLQELAWARWPSRWARDVAEPRLGYPLDPWQTDLLDDRSRRLLLLVHRQGGKSTVVAIKALYQAVTWRDQTVVLVSPTQRQSSELLLRIRRLVHSMPEYERMLTVDNVFSVEFSNGSRVLSLPATNWNVRGITADLVVVDEAAGAPDQIFAALSPMLLTTGGQLVLVSTPRAKSGVFYQAYCSDLYSKRTVRASENPRMQDPDRQTFLLSELQSLGSRLYGQEYECEFLDDLDAGRIKRSWWRFYDVKELPSILKSTRDVTVSWDTAQKTAELSDYSVGTVWARAGEECYLVDMTCEKLLFPELVKEVCRLHDRYRASVVLIEDKSSGTSLIQELRAKRRDVAVRPIDPGRMDKGQRLDVATPPIESGHVWLPAEDAGGGVLVPTKIARDVMDNLAAFPAGEHDDITDSVSQYLVWMRSKTRGPRLEWLRRPGGPGVGVDELRVLRYLLDQLPVVVDARHGVVHRELVVGVDPRVGAVDHPYARRLVLRAVNRQRRHLDIVEVHVLLVVDVNRRVRPNPPAREQVPVGVGRARRLAQLRRLVLDRLGLLPNGDGRPRGHHDHRDGHHREHRLRPGLHALASS